MSFPISDKLYEVLRAWHEQAGCPTSGLVFPSQVTGKRMTKGAMQKKWKQIKLLAPV